MKKLLKITVVILSLSILVCLTGCAADKEAKDTLKSMLDTLSEGKYVEAMEKYVPESDSGYDFLNCRGSFNADTLETYEMYDALFKSIEYEIGETKVINENEVHFKTKITTADLAPVGTELAEDTAAYNIAAENAEEDEQLSDEELNRILGKQTISICKDYLSGSDVKKRTTELEISTYYDPSRGWCIHIDEDFMKAVSGGVYEAFYKRLKESEMVKK